MSVCVCVCAQTFDSSIIASVINQFNCLKDANGHQKNAFLAVEK